MLRRTFTIVVCAAALAASAACKRSAERVGSAERADSAAIVAADKLRPLDGARAARISAENADAAEPAVAAAGDGTAYVAWVEHGAGGAADVRLAHVGGDGKLIDSTPARVNPAVGAATAWRGDPPTLALAPDGTIYVGWTARVEGTPHASVIELSVSRDGGRTFAAPVRVNDDAKPGGHGMHSLAVGRDGRVHVAWLDERDAAPAHHTEPTVGGKHKEANREVFYASSTDGGRTFSANHLVAKEACPCCKTALAVGTDGRVYVSWRQVLPGEFRHVAIASTADGGQTFSQPVVVSDDRWQIAGCPVSGSALSVAADGALRVLWYSAGEGASEGLYWSESRDVGKTFTPRQLFAERSAGGTPILTGGGGDDLAAVWEDRGDRSSRIVAASLDVSARTARGGGVLAASGEVPAASAAGGLLFAAYTSGDNGQRGLWIVSASSSPRAGS